MARSKEICFLLERSTKIKTATKFIIVAGKLNKYLRGFQTDQPMVPFLNRTLLGLLYSLMSMFVNNDTMKKATFSLKLLKINTSDTSLYKHYAAEVGMGAKMRI